LGLFLMSEVPLYVGRLALPPARGADSLSCDAGIPRP